METAKRATFEATLSGSLGQIWFEECSYYSMVRHLNLKHMSTQPIHMNEEEHKGSSLQILAAGSLDKAVGSCVFR